MPDRIQWTTYGKHHEIRAISAIYHCIPSAEHIELVISLFVE